MLFVGDEALGVRKLACAFMNCPIVCGNLHKSKLQGGGKPPHSKGKFPKSPCRRLDQCTLTKATLPRPSAYSALSAVKAASSHTEELCCFRGVPLRGSGRKVRRERENSRLCVDKPHRGLGPFSSVRADEPREEELLRDLRRPPDGLFPMARSTADRILRRGLCSSGAYIGRGQSE